MEARLLSEIRVGERHRKDFGDIESLAKNIGEIGLLHPIVIQPDGSLIAGARRLMAFKLLGREEIPVTVISIEKLARGEYAENTFRDAVRLSEIVAITRTLEEFENAAARGRRGGDHKGNVGNFPELNGRARDKIAKQSGGNKSGRTVQKALAVVAAAEAEPEKFGKLQADMDRTGRVDGPLAEDRCYQIRWRAANKAGELLKAMEKAKGAAEPGTNRGTTRSGNSTASPRTLEQLGISKQQSSDWQKIAGVPKDEFEQALAEKSVEGLIAKPRPVSSDALSLIGTLPQMMRKSRRQGTTAMAFNHAPRGGASEKPASESFGSYRTGYPPCGSRRSARYQALQNVETLLH